MNYTIRKSPRTKLIKMDSSLYEETKKIAAKRFAEGLDGRYSPTTVQRKIVKHNLWQQIKKDLEIAKFLKDDNGQYDLIFSPFRIAIVAFLVLVLFGGLIYATGLINDQFNAIGLQNEVNSGLPGYVNLTQAAQNTFGQFNNSIQALRMVAITLIFSEILLMVVFASFKKIHPVLFIVWVFIVFLAVLLAAPIANAYETLLQGNIYNGLLQTFTGGNWFVLNLPLMIAVVGFLGAILMFINIRNGGGQDSL